MLPVLPSLSRFCENACRKLPRLVEAEPDALPSELVSAWKLCCSESSALLVVLVPVALEAEVLEVLVPEDSCWIRLCRFDSICEAPPPCPPIRPRERCAEAVVVELLPSVDCADVEEEAAVESVVDAEVEEVELELFAVVLSELAGGGGGGGWPCPAWDTVCAASVVLCPLAEDWLCKAEISVCMKLPSACSAFELESLVDVLPLADVADDVPDVPDMPDWESAWKIADTNVPTWAELLVPVIGPLVPVLLVEVL